MAFWVGSYDLHLGANRTIDSIPQDYVFSGSSRQSTYVSAYGQLSETRRTHEGWLSAGLTPSRIEVEPLPSRNAGDCP